MKDWKDADEISDRIIDLMNARLKAGVDPVSLLAGQLLGLLGFMRTAPPSQPASFRAVAEAAHACLRDMTLGEADHGETS